MKRKLIMFLSLFCIGIGIATAQTQVRGTVVDEAGEPIIGATIQLKSDATRGTVTDIDGNFSLSAPANGTLVISYVGLITQEVPVGPTVKVSFLPDMELLDEVVVTALGLTREKKSLGYAVADIKSEELLKSRGGLTNPINSLAGKVSGLQISGASGNLGGSSKILIRGAKSISGNNQPLFIIDGVPIEGKDFNTTDAARGGGGYDYGNLIQDINPDDIESISVLKGPNASALYGSRATNGVVMIITKKGAKATRGLGITVNSGIGFERVNKLPVMQRKYGGGYSFKTTTINGKQYNTIEYKEDVSWGPEFDGKTQYLSWYDLAKWEDAGKTGDPTTSTWQAPVNDINTFFETGISSTNNISISKANENAAFRVSYTNMILKGYMPNSHLQKNSFNISGSAKIAKIYEVFSNVSYLNQATKGRPETGYGDNNVMQKFIQWGQRQLDMKELESLYKYKDGPQAVWNRNSWSNPRPAYSNNPYWSRYMNYQNDTRNRLYGNVGLKMYILPNLTVQLKSNLDFFSDKQYERHAVYSQEESSYGEYHRQQYELNNELLLQYNTNLNEALSLNMNAGGNAMYRNYQQLLGYSVSGLVLPEFYNLSNSRSPSKSDNYMNEKAINSIYASGTLGYKSLAYLDATIRNDWSSSLNGKGYLYYSATGSLLLSELIKQSWLSFSKLRLGYAKVGGDTDPYRISDTYTFYTSLDQSHAYLLPLTKNNPDLRPEQTHSYEAGLEAMFLDNRIGFDVTLYKSITEDQIMPLSLSGTTGYTSRIINAGKMENKGIEFKLDLVPLKLRDFEWTTTLTLARNKNKVIDLIEGVDYYRITNAPFKVEIGAYKGDEYGVIMGTDFLYDDKGNKKIDADGFYLYTNGNVPLGSVYPDFTGGILNTFRYKNFSVSILFDGQKGGKFFSTSHMWGMYSGMLEESADLNELGNPKRNDPADGGGVLLEGVLEDGSPNKTRISASDWAQNFYFGPAAQNVLRSDFIKLREVSLSYNIPLKFNVIQALNVSAYGRNLALWGPDTKHFDPEAATTSSGNIQGIEGGALPSIASFGVNIGIQF